MITRHTPRIEMHIRRQHILAELLLWHQKQISLAKEMWQKVKVMKKKNKTLVVSALLDTGGKLVILPEDKANILGEQYRNASSDLNLSAFPSGEI